MAALISEAYNYLRTTNSYKSAYNIQMFKKRNIKTNAIDLAQIKQEGLQVQNGQPKKRVKLQKPQQSNAIGGSTSSKNANIEQQSHRDPQSSSYKKPSHKQEQILSGQAAAQLHETEQAKALYLQNIESTKKIKSGQLSTKIYRGLNNYANYTLSQSELDNPLENYKWKHGPTRAAKEKGGKNTCRFDYDPSLCKDWHDSGYCVFGNSCIYLHDRSNYKTGWEMEKDYEKGQRERWKRIMNPDANQQPDHIKDLHKYKPQQTCKACNLVLQSPVQVSCQHIFCRKCVDTILDTDSKCPECGKILNGIMNNVEKMLAKKKEEYEEMVRCAGQEWELSKVKKDRYRDMNSLDVFNHQ